MKKSIVFINVVCNGSTGKIMCETAKMASKKGFDVYCFYGRGQAKSIENVHFKKIGNKIPILFHGLIARLGYNGHGSYLATKKLIKEIKNINPSIIHLHNIHGYYLNIKVLFNYLKNEFQGKIIWTLHDCWAFTGHCSHFTYVNCDKWKHGCHNCPQLNCYPKEYLDTTKKEYNLKRELFTGINNLTLVTPSNWLANLVKKSFLKNYEVKIVNNGIDLNIFKKTIDKEIFEKYNIPQDKKIILGISSIWNNRKGLKDFYELAQLIKDDTIIILVGSNIKEHHEKIILIEKTENQQELAKLYSIATVFFNPTYEDTYPTVNLESIACGTPVITYNGTGSIESAQVFGTTIAKKDYNKLLDYLNHIDKIKNKDISYNKLNSEELFKEYIKIYEEKGE